LSRAEQFLRDPKRNQPQLLAFLGATHDPRGADLMFSLQREDGSVPIHVVLNIPSDDPRSVLVLARALSSDVRYSYDDYISHDARWQLASVSDIDMRAQHILISAISHAAGREKADYLIALAFVSEGQSRRRVFEEALSDSDAEVRCSAAWALGEGAGHAESIPLLEELLEDTARVERPGHSEGPHHASVREAADEAIRKISQRR
jgi:HEAT repeat protein